MHLLLGHIHRQDSSTSYNRLTYFFFHPFSFSAAEFVVYKLKEMGKISEEDIAVVMAGFRSLDIDHSGTLTNADLMNPE